MKWMSRSRLSRQRWQERRQNNDRRSKLRTDPYPVTSENDEIVPVHVNPFACGTSLALVDPAMIELVARKSP